MRFTRVLTLTLLLGVAWPVTSALAQPVGMFRWQTQPYCNILTIAVVRQAGLYLMDGTDDQCGAPQQASIVGLAFQNPDGTIGFGLTIVTAPGGTPVHIDAAITVATLGGTWRDSAGNSGTFIFTPGAGTGGPPRPVLPGGLPPGSVTAIQIGAGAVGASEIVDGAVGAADVNIAEVQLRVTGTCTNGQVLIGVNANGTVVCTGVAQSGQVFSGQVANIQPANASFTLVSGSYPVPLPPGTPSPTLEYRPGATTSATCPGIGQATAGRLCVYGFNTLNISSISLGGGISPPSQRFGFSLDVISTIVASEGYFIANWAYRVP
jgi:hypothetical protein